MSLALAVCPSDVTPTATPPSNATVASGLESMYVPPYTALSLANAYAHGVSLQAVKYDGQAALHKAAEAGQEDAEKYLLLVGADAPAQEEVKPIWPTTLQRLSAAAFHPHERVARCA